MLTFEVRLTLQSPLHIGNGKAPASGTDPAPLSRDWRGKPCVPSTTLKGAHRHTAAVLASSLGLTACQSGDPQRLCHPITGKPPCIICQIFGSPWLTGRIYYRDLVTTASITQMTITRSTLSRSRRVQRAISQKQIEVAPAGTVFTGQIQHLLADRAQMALALIALRSINGLGAANSAGVGLVKVEVQALDANKAPVNERDLIGALEGLRDYARRSAKGNQP